MPDISQKRIEELVIRLMDKEVHRARIEYALRVAIRLGIREGLEVAARESEWLSLRPVTERIRAITIEGER